MNPHSANRVPFVPTEFRRAHPELRKEARPLTATIALLVNEEGRVVETRLDKSSGFADLDHLALRIAGDWRFNPASLDGKPACSWGRLAATFKWK